MQPVRGSSILSKNSMPITRLKLWKDMKNHYSCRSRISEAKFREVVRHFSVNLTALQSAELSDLNRNTINRIYRILRELIAQACED